MSIVFGILLSLVINPAPPSCCDASGSWCVEDYGPAVAAGQCITVDGTIEDVTFSGDMSLLFWEK